jgi:hypothetical protein
MTAIERLKDLLKTGGKVRGHKEPIYRPDKSLDHYAVQMIEVPAGDLAEVADLADKKHPVVGALHMGASQHEPEVRVTIKADDLFTLIEQAEGIPQP